MDVTIITGLNDRPKDAACLMVAVFEDVTNIPVLIEVTFKSGSASRWISFGSRHDLNAAG